MSNVQGNVSVYMRKNNKKKGGFKSTHRFSSSGSSGFHFIFCFVSKQCLSPMEYHKSV